MPAGDIEIRAILDTSAMLSYSRGHVHVGELLVDIADEGAYVGLPTVALLEAYAQTSDRPAAARLGVLATLPGVTVLPLSAPDAAQAATTVRLTKGDLARAHAVWAALKHDAYYLTCEPHLVPAVIAAELVHQIPVHDA
ncbi:hypothetical protein ONA91_27565 [Micromonospora sp. DR5-3]|uniref:type II toxin-antitoxin system VapC family toxin n=1 Tax=unclassified Micromonospora TaxID=2617518 RepID=UPI0011D37719|nr:MULTISPECIES: type II toxin-antitoxin system VapC family toxin [unclassified Micromonospora]MCW3818215.1 hypothetical protein [Micromonospora sp. DR5-3]TYC21664.1 type II toxin-antitoxin system VapC family toxin [Micromonospora sp. MP36]